ncbi:response regulator [Humibacter ginsenosidimutans]|uniref:Response regulator transcription factor n=1 Tax=Humibacter ginsenosidimutans TaxID=2599293 RepID=A0A5B8M4N0_9MICO|nr:response regulator transcription factor [Humibacter ginsenosidimutans]QDZ15276.1 response regulator transcription factor [Humibacter ginsenosidimutans]
MRGAIVSVRVVIVDDETLVRSGLSMILGSADDIEVVGTSGPDGALEVIAATDPDLVLMDIRMPGTDGITLLRLIRARGERPPVAMLTTFDADEYVATALREGACGFLLKDSDPEELPQLVRTLAGGGIVLSSKVGGRLVGRYLGDDDNDARSLLTALTARERDVLALLAQGLSNAEIGAKLFLSAATIKDHVSAILLKFGVTSRVQAALIAERGGLLRDEEAR